MSAGDTVTKTVWQYSETLPEETMDFLKKIASDYRKVKNCVYERYSGIKSLGRLTPVYDILTEMRHCGLREQLDLPVVYYELAIADAVTDIKAGWGTVRNKIGTLITVNENLSDSDRIYLRTVLKMNSVYAAILNHQEYEMPKNAEGLDIDVNRLNNLLCRLTRKYLTQPVSVQPEMGGADFFKISPNGYSYKDGAMRIVCRVPRKRIPIPLKDSRTFDRQIQVHIKKDYVALAVPIEAKIKKHTDYTNTVYIHIGYRDMLTLSNGNIYGEALGNIVTSETERLARKNKERHRIRMLHGVVRNQGQESENGDPRKVGNIEANNLGKLKYDRQKDRERHRTETFINTEINRMLKTEKPGKVVITRPVAANRVLSKSKTANRRLSRSFYSYIRERLAYKCRVNSIELVEVNSKGTGNICSACGAEGKRQGFEFICESCGRKTTVALNSAQNMQIKYSK